MQRSQQVLGDKTLINGPFSQRTFISPQLECLSTQLRKHNLDLVFFCEVPA